MKFEDVKVGMELTVSRNLKIRGDLRLKIDDCVDVEGKNDMSRQIKIKPFGIQLWVPWSLFKESQEPEKSTFEKFYSEITKNAMDAFKKFDEENPGAIDCVLKAFGNSEKEYTTLEACMMLDKDNELVFESKNAAGKQVFLKTEQYAYGKAFLLYHENVTLPEMISMTYGINNLGPLTWKWTLVEKKWKPKELDRVFLINPIKLCGFSEVVFYDCQEHWIAFNRELIFKNAEEAAAKAKELGWV